MHPFVEDRDDADGAVVEAFPIDVVLFVTAEIAVDAELGGNRAPGDVAGGDGFEFGEKAADVGAGLGLALGARG